MLKSAVSGGGYGPLDAEWALGGPTAACFAVQRKAGLVINKPSTVPAGSSNQIAASGQACTQMALLTAILQKAGPTLNYGTFAAAGNSLGKIVLPASPDPWTSAPPPDIDGNPKVYLYHLGPDHGPVHDRQRLGHKRGPRANIPSSAPALDPEAGAPWLEASATTFGGGGMRSTPRPWSSVAHWR